jgi:RNA polymerase sigma-70 factor (ECF subfamily)
MSPLREQQLVQAYQSGDPAALGELLSAYQRRVYAVCARMVRARGEAADLTQDALVKIIEGLNGYDGRAAVSTWIIRVTINCCLSHLRREQIRRHGSLDEPVGPGGGTRGRGLSSAELSPAAHVEQAERQAVLLRALTEVEPPMRAVLVLRDLQDLDYQQIAEVLSVPVGTVKSRLFRARAALRRVVERTMETGAGSGPEGADREGVDADG